MTNDLFLSNILINSNNRSDNSDSSNNSDNISNSNNNNKSNRNRNMSKLTLLLNTLLNTIKYTDDNTTDTHEGDYCKDVHALLSCMLLLQKSIGRRTVAILLMSSFHVLHHQFYR